MQFNSEFDLIGCCHYYTVCSIPRIRKQYVIAVSYGTTLSNNRPQQAVEYKLTSFGGTRCIKKLLDTY